MATKIAIEQLGRKASVCLADLASTDELRELVTRIIGMEAQVDIFVNCPGSQRRHSTSDFPIEDWDEVSARIFCSVETHSQPHGRSFTSI